MILGRLRMLLTWTLQETQEAGFMKVLSFWAEVSCHYDASYILKADDSVYVNLQKIPLLLDQWHAMEVGENLHHLLSATSKCWSSFRNSAEGTWKFVFLSHLQDSSSLQLTRYPGNDLDHLPYNIGQQYISFVSQKEQTRGTSPSGAAFIIPSEPGNLIISGTAWTDARRSIHPSTNDHPRGTPSISSDHLHMQ